MASRSAEEWFELGMAWDSNAESLDQAAQAYRKAVDAAPEWVEAHINLGTAFINWAAWRKRARSL